MGEIHRELIWTDSSFLLSHSRALVTVSICLLIVGITGAPLAIVWEAGINQNYEPVSLLSQALGDFLSVIKAGREYNYSENEESVCPRASCLQEKCSWLLNPPSPAAWAACRVWGWGLACVSLGIKVPWINVFRGQKCWDLKLRPQWSMVSSPQGVGSWMNKCFTFKSYIHSVTNQL